MKFLQGLEAKIGVVVVETMFGDTVDLPAGEFSSRGLTNEG